MAAAAGHLGPDSEDGRPAKGASLTAKFLVPLALLLALVVTLLVTFASRGVARQEEALAEEAADIGLSVLHRSLAYSMAQGVPDFGPLLRDLEQGLPHVRDVRLVSTESLGLKRTRVADAWERQVLAAGERRAGFVGAGEARGYRVVLPIVADASCQRCHSIGAGQVAASVSMTIATSEWERDARRLQITMVATSAAALGALLLLVVMIARRVILRPLASASALARELSLGDLRRRLPVEAADEVGALTASLDRMADGLQALLAGIAASAERVAQGSAVVAGASRVQADGAQAHAGSSAAAAASMEELTASITTNADEAARASELSQLVVRKGREGAAAVAKALAALKAIAERAGLVGEVAYQTNLLAINAAIEARHAGEHGRGFAVVAEQIRQLADRSRGSAREVASLTRGSASEAGLLGELIESLIRDVEQSASHVETIALTCAEQARTARLLSETSIQLERASEAAARGFSEASDASRLLAAEAESLRALVQRFRLRGPDA